MLRDYAILPVVASAGFIAGADLRTFTAAALAAAASTWLAQRCRTDCSCFVVLDPRNPDGAPLLDALRQALERVCLRRQSVCLRIAARSSGCHPDLRLDLDREGDLVLSSGKRQARLKQAGLWLPDHPLPLPLPRARGTTLYLQPATPSRVRASARLERARLRDYGVALTALAALAIVLNYECLLAAVLGFAFQTYLLEQQARSPQGDARVHRA